MIQTLGDIFLLTAIISVGIVAFLLAIFLYHLIFVVMDLRQVMKRVNDLTSEIEEMLMAPVQMVAGVIDWVQKWLLESAMAEPTKSKRKERRSKKRKKKPGGKKK